MTVTVPDVWIGNDGWMLSGMEYPSVTGGRVMTNGDGYFHQFIGFAHGREVWDEVALPPSGTFLYWNGSTYLEYIKVTAAGDPEFAWLWTDEMVRSRALAARLLGNDRVLLAPRPYAEVGARGGNQKGPWYTSAPMYLWLVLGTLVWVIGTIVIYGAQTGTNDEGSLWIAVASAFGFLGVWLLYLCALAAALFRVQVSTARWLTGLIGAFVAAHYVRNKIQDHNGSRFNEGGGWK